MLGNSPRYSNVYPDGFPIKRIPAPTGTPTMLYAPLALLLADRLRVNGERDGRIRRASR
jgi:hypothetical protein